MTVLAVSAGLFLVLIFHIGLFLDSLFVCDLRSGQLNLYFVFVQQSGVMEAGPVLLEPIMSLKVTVPDAYTGDIMGDLNKRRGRVLGMTPMSGGKQIIEADIPMSGLFGYCTDLRSMTGGRGDYSYEFARYEQAPSDVQEKEVAARAAKVAENNAED